MNIKIRSKVIFSTPRLLALGVLSVLVILSIAAPLSAQSVLQSYNSDEKLQRGMLVTLKGDDQNKVEAITDKTLDKMKGVVADSNDSPVTLSDGTKKIFVATVGNYEVLVSNENGKISSGDYISGSSLAGIGMKANSSQSVILGRAIGKFEGGGDSIGKSTAKDGKSIEFARIKVDIGVGKNPLLKEPKKDQVLGVLQNVASAISDKPVSPLRIYLSLLIIIITGAIAGTMLFGGARSSVIALGRNPLSKHTIFKGMFQVLLLSMIIFITGLFGVYLLIKL